MCRRAFPVPGFPLARKMFSMQFRMRQRATLHRGQVLVKAESIHGKLKTNGKTKRGKMPFFTFLIPFVRIWDFGLERNEKLFWKLHFENTELKPVGCLKSWLVAPCVFIYLFIFTWRVVQAVPSPWRLWCHQIWIDEGKGATSHGIMQSPVGMGRHCGGMAFCKQRNEISDKISSNLMNINQGGGGGWDATRKSLIERSNSRKKIYCEIMNAFALQIDLEERKKRSQSFSQAFSLTAV